MISFQQTPQTFFVEEVLAYEPSGDGEHVFAKIRKTGLSTFALKRKLSERLGVPLKDVSHAGKKDAAATSVQWISWPKKAERAPLKEGMYEDFEILSLSQHSHSLSPGHIRSNRFELKLFSQGDATFGEVDWENAIFPNFFGTQRFGSTAPEWLPEMAPSKGRKPSKDHISVVQASLFNGFLQNRLRVFGKTIFEDEFWMHAGGKRFFQTPLDSVIQERFLGGEIFPSGPIFGYKIPVSEMEESFLQNLGLKIETFRIWGKAAKGARRPLFARADDFSIEPFDDGFWLRFGLPSGSYATVFLIHLLSPSCLERPLSSWPNFTNLVRWERNSLGNFMEMA